MSRCVQFTFGDKGEVYLLGKSVLPVTDYSTRILKVLKTIPFLYLKAVSGDGAPSLGVMNLKTLKNLKDVF